MTKANEMQVGGDHYRSDYQHWDLIIATGMAYLEGQATRYIARWRKKNGLEDLKKALHYINKLEESANLGLVASPLHATTEARAGIVKEVSRFAKANNLTELEKVLIMNLAIWHNKEDINGARDLLLMLMDEADPEPQEPEPVPLTEENHHAERDTTGW